MAAAGVSYYWGTQRFGIPVGVGYQQDHAAIIGGYDLLMRAPVIHGGYTNTSKDRIVTSVVPPT